MRKPAWPIPRLLAEAKHTKGGVTARGYLDRNALRVGFPAQSASPYETLRGLFVNEDGRVAKPLFGGRLRTAVKDGRADPGRLFGFQHVEAGHVRTYRAVIEADDQISMDVWTRLLSAFDHKTLRLGRGSGTAYGGGYQSFAVVEAA